MKRSYELFNGVNNQNMDTEISNKVLLVERNANPQGVELVNVHRVGKRAPNDLVQLAQEISKADISVKANAFNQLSVIAQQIKHLQHQAQQILQDAKTNIDLHHIACNFQKVPNKIYHVYRRPSGQRYLSMLSVEEWNGLHTHEYLGSYRLEYDQSWTPIENIQKKDTEMQMLNCIYQGDNFKYALQDVDME